ncbi:hypothetical protein QNI19_35630 [Cytophagaceae bacterium DM2B3-1]|uniref:DUF4173 domain-containing protein n=1 Tax=Xanthocytophaga flava TaxID=3048013 RepID=A0ABT7CZC9_9BACT|nr:hypothetical protein [Xanthocytophaga flavus]MDJ1498320.1 hypothetical protein [Xanthocytophaga flavus]
MYFFQQNAPFADDVILIPYGFLWVWQLLLEKNYKRALLVIGVWGVAETALHLSADVSITSTDSWSRSLSLLVIFPLAILLLGFIRNRKQIGWYYLFYLTFSCLTTSMNYVEYTFTDTYFFREYLGWMIFKVEQQNNVSMQVSILGFLLTFLLPYLYHLLLFTFENWLVSENKKNLLIFLNISTKSISRRAFALGFGITYLCVCGNLFFIGKTLSLILQHNVPYSPAYKWIFIPYSVLLFLPLIYVCRNILIQRLVTLHKKISWTYIVSFIPVVNLIPFLVLTFSKEKTDEESAYTYRTMMNDWHSNTNQLLIWLIVGGNILYTLYHLLVLFKGHGASSQIESIMVIVLLVQSFLLLYFASSPQGFYWLMGLISIKFIWMLIALIFDSSNYGKGAAIMGIVQCMLMVGVLIIYQQLFHPTLVFTEEAAEPRTEEHYLPS